MFIEFCFVGPHLKPCLQDLEVSIAKLSLALAIEIDVY